jgi:hypothetical protein
MTKMKGESTVIFGPGGIESTLLYVLPLPEVEER